MEGITSWSCPSCGRETAAGHGQDGRATMMRTPRPGDIQSPVPRGRTGMSAWAPGRRRRYKKPQVRKAGLALQFVCDLTQSKASRLNWGEHAYGFNRRRGRWASGRRRLSGSLAVRHRRAGPDCHPKQTIPLYSRLARTPLRRSPKNFRLVPDWPATGKAKAAWPVSGQTRFAAGVRLAAKLLLTSRAWR